MEEGMKKLVGFLDDAEDSLKKFFNKIGKLNELKKTQGTSGNWDYDPYMRGLYNGLELCLSILEGRETVYKEKPEVWLKDKPVPELSKQSE